MLPWGAARFDDEHELENFPHLDAVRFVRYDALDTLRDKISDQSSLLQHRGFAFALKRNEHARSFILAGRDTDAIIDAIERLGSLKALPANGLLFLIE